eukprot:scaffold7352_cov254-Pinguiococcus_pyrenoidosus.AAC.6
MSGRLVKSSHGVYQPTWCNRGVEVGSRHAQRGDLVPLAFPWVEPLDRLQRGGALRRAPNCVHGLVGSVAEP